MVHSPAFSYEVKHAPHRVGNRIAGDNRRNVFRRAAARARRVADRPLQSHHRHRKICLWCGAAGRAPEARQHPRGEFARLHRQVDSNQGVGAFSPGFGPANATHYTPVLETKPLPEKLWFYPIDHEKNTATFQALDSNFKVKFPLHPFLGCIGVCPAGGAARSSIVLEKVGGNMNAPEASADKRLYLPVNVSGALLYFGDGHAAMAKGEVADSAV